MNVTRHLDGFQIVKISPNLHKRIGQWGAARRRKTVVARLVQFRKALEAEMAPEPWTALSGPAVLWLVDVCNSLELDADEQARVLGQVGMRALEEALRCGQPRALVLPVPRQSTCQPRMPRRRRMVPAPAAHRMPFA